MKKLLLISLILFISSLLKAQTGCSLYSGISGWNTCINTTLINGANGGGTKLQVAMWLDTIAKYALLNSSSVSSFNTRTGAVTLTSGDITTALTYTPVTNARTITINGTTLDLSANRSWTISTITSPLTTKGDIWVYGAIDQRLGVGSDGRVLTANSASASGLSWSAMLTYSAGIGLGMSVTGVFSVTPTQNITGLTNLTSNGYVKTSGGVGTLSVSTTVPYTDLTGVPAFITLSSLSGTSPIVYNTVTGAISFDFTVANTFTALQNFTKGITINSVTPTPSTPTSGFVLFAASTHALSWKGQNGFVRTFDGTSITADRTYTLPDHAFTLDNITTSSTTNGTGFVYGNGSAISFKNGTSSQFLKADGSFDGSTYLTSSFYTFSTGLTNASGTITANLATGVSGGQSAIGGTGTTDQLIFKSTTGNQTSGTAFTWLSGNNGVTTGMKLSYDGHLTIEGVTSTGATGTGKFVFGTSPDFITSATIGGIAIPTISSTNTLTNKRWTPRDGNTTSSATPTINTDNVDQYRLTALAVAITSMTTNLSGTPTEGQLLIIEFTDNGTARAITWGTSFENGGLVNLPTTTVISTLLGVVLKWNSATSKWRCAKVY